MNISLISGLVFVGVFAGVVLIHELGHFLAARLFKIDVEEFGIGLPPRALRLWRARGSMMVGGKKLEIPRNFDLPFNDRSVPDTLIEVSANEVDDRLVLASVSYEEKSQLESSRDDSPESLLRVDRNGEIVDGEPGGGLEIQKQMVGKPGEIQLRGRVTDIHQGTEFTLNWLPLGGFVRPKGENDPNITGGLAAANPWMRLGVLVAGPFMNLLAAVLVNSILFSQVGIPDMSRVMLYEVSPGSPAEQAGLQAEDFVLAVDGIEIADDDDFRDAIQAHLDQPMQITVQRGDESLDIIATPLSNRTTDEGALGILPGPPMVPAESYFQAIPFGAIYTYSQVRQIISLPAQIVRGNISPEEGRFIGLKGIYDIFGQAVSRDVETREPEAVSAPEPVAPTNFTLQIIASLTLTLGIFNLLPFPALDGGRIMFVLPELVIRRRVPAEFENWVHAVGFLLLLLFMLYINVMDFINPVQINLP